MSSDWPVNPPRFGSEMRKEFLLDEGVTFLNHCGKGAVPRKVFNTQIRLAEEIERNPENFWKLTKLERWNSNLRLIADFLGADVTNLTFVENTTRGISNILTSYPFEEGDAILYNSYTHKVVKNQIRGLLKLKKELHLQCVEVPLELPGPGSHIVQQYTEYLKRHSNIRLVVTDYVCGRPATLFPVHQLVTLCHAHSVHILVDAAHATGLVPLQLEELGADFVVGSFYKWLFCPRGCAIKYTHPLLHSHVRPSILALDSEAPYPRAFVDQGTRDEVPYLCVGEALRFYRWLGGYEALCAYNIPLVDAAEDLLSSSWGTSLAEYPKDELVPFLRNIRLPQLKAYSTDNLGCTRLGYDLYHRYKIWVGVFVHQHTIWVRVAGQIYCTLDDFQRLRDAILELKDEDTDSPRQVESRQQFEAAQILAP